LKALHYLLLAGFLGVLLFASPGLPRLGDAASPVTRDTSPAGTPVAGGHYIRNAYQDAATDNLVTVVLADYRGFDTLGETIVVFAAGVACFLILRGTRT
jgi:multicomponent Na+:H+ antiporter subunit B